MATDVLTSAALATSAVTEIQSGLALSTQVDDLESRLPGTIALTAAGRVDVGLWLGSAPNALISGRVDANAQVVGDKTGYSLTQTFPTNFSAMSITASGTVAANVEGALLIGSVTTGAGGLLADYVWDEVLDGSVTGRQSIRLANSANAGKLSGAATTNVVIRDLADSKNRVDATVDADGNRTAVTIDVS
jgi:hypothetical protein